MDEEADLACNSSGINWRNCTEERGVSITRPETILVPVCFALIFLSGTVGNVFLLLFEMKKRKMKTAHDIFVTSLAIGDMFLILLAMPFVSTIYTFDSWPYGAIICRMSEFTQTFSAAVTVFTLTALSVERYIIICASSSSRHRKRHAFLIVGVAWATSLILSVPEIMSANVWRALNDEEFCLVFQKSWGAWYSKMNIMLKFLLLFLFPLMVITPFYMAVSIELIKEVLSRGPQTRTRQTSAHNDSQEIHNKPEADTKRHRARRGRLAVVVLLLIFSFLLCYLPRYIYLLWFHFVPGYFNHFWHVFKIVGFCLFFSNSAVNPLVFYVLDVEFRSYVNSKACCKKSGSRKGIVTNPTIENQTIALTEYTHNPMTGDKI